jgi:hypothetical protein
MRFAVGKQRLVVEPKLISREQACTLDEESVVRLGIDEAIAAGSQDGPILTDVQRFRGGVLRSEAVRRDIGRPLASRVTSGGPG